MDLMLRQGDIEAQRVANRGQVWGNALAGIGQTVDRSLAGLIQRRQDAPRRQLQALQIEDALMQRAAGQRQLAENQQIGRLLQESLTQTPEGRPTVDRQRFFSGVQQAGLGHRMADVLPMLDKVDPPPEYTTAPAGAGVLDKRTGKITGTVEPRPVAPTKASLAAAAAAGDPAAQAALDKLTPKAEPKRYPVTVPGPDGRPVQKLFTEDELAAGVPAYREPKAAGDGEPLVAIMGADGHPVLVPRSQAVNKRPANTREQGRPVTSGDAGRIAEFDTSLDDLTVLRAAVSGKPGVKDTPAEKATGARAKIGAMVPNFVTEYTGWGSDAKSKQAVIDRVKQVIGKALEGGVLRKEDEYKYEKILPTIGDPPEVVETKLAGLEQAIKLRRTRFIESLGDANYDTSKFPAEYTPKGKADPLGIR